MSSESSFASSTPSIRRLVARRACLSCREKKIKCDGEAPSTNDSQRSTSPNLCSNCKFLGIECVFVRSMRGGRRKKRTLVTEDSLANAVPSKNLKTDQTGVDHSQPKEDLRSTPSSTLEKEDKPEASHFPIFDLGKASRPLSPTLSYASSGYPDPGIVNRMDKLRSSSLSDQMRDPNDQSRYASYDYMRQYGPPPHPGGPPLHSPPPPMSSGPLPPPPPPPPPTSIPLPPGDQKYYRRLYGPYGPPRNVPPPPRDYYGARGGPRRNYRHHDPPPMMPGYGGSPPLPLMPGHLYPPNGHIGHSHPQQPHPQPNGPYGYQRPGIPVLPPIDGKEKGYSEYGSYLFQKNQPQQFNREAATSAWPNSNAPQSQPQGSNGNQVDLKQPHQQDEKTLHLNSQTSNDTRNEKPSTSNNKSIGNSDVHTQTKSDSVSLRSADVKSVSDRMEDDKSISSGSDDRQRFYSGERQLASDTAYPPVYGHPYNTYNKDYFRNSLLSTAPRSIHEEYSSVTSNPGSEKSSLTPPQQLRFDLPDNKTLDHLLNLYYRYNHPGHQILPKKSILLQYFPVDSCPAIYHAIIASISRLNDKVSKDEEVWIANAYKYWDNLNSLQMFLTYIMISKTLKYSTNLKNGLELNKKIWNCIRSQKLIETYKQLTKEEYLEILSISTTRQLFERELMVRLIWDFWVHRTVIFRIRAGDPYNRLSTILHTDKSEFENNHYSDHLEIPIDNESYLTSIKNYKLSKRFSWPDLHFELSKDIPESESSIFSDSTAIVLSSSLLYTAADTISRNGLLKTNFAKLVTYGDKLEKAIINDIFRLTKENCLVINGTFLLSHFILKAVKILCNFSFIREIMVFKFYQKSDNELAELDFFPLINDVTIQQLPDLELLPQVIKKLTNFQWTCFASAVNSVLDIIKLLELGEGLIPENLTHRENKPLSTTRKTYKVAVGVTDSGESDKPWWEGAIHTSRVLNTSDQADAWLQYPEFCLMSISAQIVALASFVVLSKYIKFEANGDAVTVVISIGDEVEKQTIEVQSTMIAQQISQEFEQNFLLEKIATCTNFLKSHARFSNGMASDSILKAERIIHYLEEISTHSKT
ncbi:hypothetical protein CAAN1_12S03070 [[Candida] anglica]|uniref:Zn(2)-C6 fungal-type domain-containing protein n=1 Tax=[Candida] anglica TaxID=148631 RepID=A0ABP0E6W2_9ASCO